jgi:hypothetical protein
MNEALIVALAARIKAGQMTIEQVPIPYQDAVLERLNGADKNESGESEIS